MLGNENETVLQYGQQATAIDQPDRTFGVLDSGDDLTFGTFPSGFTRRTDLDAHRKSEGQILLSAVDDDVYRRFGSAFEAVELESLVTDLVNSTLFSEAEARVVVLHGWFGLDRAAVASGLGKSKATVELLRQSAIRRRHRAESTADVSFPLASQQ